MRETHEFYYTASDIATSTTKKANEYAEKLVAAMSEFQSLLGKFTYRRWAEVLKVSAGINRDNTGMYPTFNEDIVAMLGLLRDIESSENGEKECRRIARSYASQGSKGYSLNLDDVRYFGLAE